MDNDPGSAAYERIDLGFDSSGRKRVINRRTQAMLEIVEAKIGHTFDILQGSYMQNPDNDSGATHNGGGVVDLRTSDIPASVGSTRAVRAMRKAGFAAWFRTQFDPDHIHAVAIGDVEMDPSARSQVVSYVNGGDGLGGSDDGPTVRPIVTFDFHDQESDMQLTDKIPGTKGKTVADALLAALQSERAIEELNKRQAKRNQRLVQRQTKLNQRIAEATKAIDGLPEGATKHEVRKLLADINATVQLVIDEPDDSVAEPTTKAAKTTKTAKTAKTTGAVK